MIRRITVLLALALAIVSCSQPDTPISSGFDLVIANGEIYDGLGGDPYVADVAVAGDRIVAIGKNLGPAKETIDATGLAVAPGFINMLSWATETLIEDGLSQSDIRQGVTLEVMGEGGSMGPLSEPIKALVLKEQGDIKYDVTWTTLGEYLQFLEDRGVSTNVASFVGATAMEEGALGVGSSLIYAPAFYAETDELIALCEVAAEYGGRYISHIRNEGNQLEEAVEELLEIARATGAPAL